MATEIATGYISIVPSMRGFGKQLTADVTRQAGVAGDQGGRAYSSGMMKHVRGIAAGLIGAFAVTKGVQFFKDSIKEASNLNESVNAVNVTFGKASKGVQKLSDDAAKSMGLSKTEFNELAVRFSNFSETVAGKGGDVVGTLKDLTTRASDFASVMNLDVNDAAQLFQSGLAGETEPLRKYGIDLSAAAVQAHALAKGIWNGKGEMTEAQKVQARYSLLMKSTNKTAGDFANTSDGLANRQRIANAQWKNAKASIGQSLLPVMQAFTGFLQDKVVPAVQAFGDWFQKDGGPAIGRFGTMLRDNVLPVLSNVVGWLIRNKDILLPIAAIVGAMIAAYKTWAMVSGIVTAAQMALNLALTMNPIGVVVMAVAGLIAALVLLWNKNEGFRNAVMAAWNAIKDAALAVWGWIKGYLEGVWNGIKAAVDVVWPAIQKIIEVVWKAIKLYVTTYIKVVKTVIETVWKAIKWATQTTWDAIKAFIIDPIRAAIEVVRTVVGNVREWLSSTWATIRERASTAWQNVKDAILTPIRAIWGAIKSALGIGEGGGITEDGPLGRLIGAFRNVVDRVAAVFGKIREAIVKPIAEAFRWVNDNVIQKLNDSILSKFGDLRIPKLPVPTYATGGWVNGPGTGTSDSVLARLSNGEFVVNARAAAANRGTLEAINSGSTLQSNSQPGGWLSGIGNIAKTLFTKGAEAAVRMIGDPAVSMVQRMVGGTVGGDIAVGSMRSVMDSITGWAKKQDIAPTQVMENLARYFEDRIHDFVGFSTCLKNVNQAMAVLESRMGFSTNGWLDMGHAVDTTRAVQRAGLMRHTRPPRGAIVLWDTSVNPSGHIAVADGKGYTLNNWGGDTIERIANIDSAVGWTPPESFIIGNKYDRGGFLPPGWSMNYNGTGKPEPVLTSEQWDRVSAGGVTNYWTVNADNVPAEEAMMTAWRRWEAVRGI
jgi:phage-related protein